MKFYVAINNEGRKVLCGTQVDAKTIDKKFTELEIAVDKTGLMAFAQSALDAIFEAEGRVNSLKFDASIQEVTIDAPEAPKLSTKVAMLQDVAITALMIEDYVLYRATMGEIEAIFACLGNRFKTMAREVQDNDPEPSSG